jgi:hypothetical protein
MKNSRCFGAGSTNYSMLLFRSSKGRAFAIASTAEMSKERRETTRSSREGDQGLLREFLLDDRQFRKMWCHVAAQRMRNLVFWGEQGRRASAGGAGALAPAPQKGPSATVRLASAGSTRDWAQILDEYQNLGQGDCIGPDPRCWELVNKLQLIGQTIPGGPEIPQREHRPRPKLTNTLPEKYVVIPGERGPVGGIGGVNIVSRSTGPSFGISILFSGAMRGRPKMPHKGISE